MTEVATTPPTMTNYGQSTGVVEWWPSVVKLIMTWKHIKNEEMQSFEVSSTQHFHPKPPKNTMPALNSGLILITGASGFIGS